MAIRYESEDGVLWLDDSVDNGGKPWLNPYSDTAQKYVLDIIYDAVDFGADAIILDGLRFPEESAAMGYAYFGVGTDDISREEALGMFAKRAYSATVTSETDLLIAFDGEKAALYGDIPTYEADGFAPYIDLTQFADKKAANGTEFGELPADTTEFVKAVYASLNLAPEAKAISVISCNVLLLNGVGSGKPAGNPVFKTSGKLFFGIKLIFLHRRRNGNLGIKCRYKKLQKPHWLLKLFFLQKYKIYYIIK